LVYAIYKIESKFRYGLLDIKVSLDFIDSDFNVLKVSYYIGCES
jgi:hypothetical protein